jgi:hypothetical protein
MTHDRDGRLSRLFDYLHQTISSEYYNFYAFFECSVFRGSVFMKDPLPLHGFCPSDL